MPVMEIIAPQGSMRLEASPTFEEYIQHYYIPLIPAQPRPRKMTEEEKLDYYCKRRKKFIRQQCQCVKAFMRQHKRRNEHKRKSVS